MSHPEPKPTAEKSGRLKLLDDAVALGDDLVARFIRAQVSNDRRRNSGRSTAMYSKLADSLALETKVSQADKRARILDARDDELVLHKSRRLTATEELKLTEQKKQVIAEQAAAWAKKRAVAAELETERKHQVWLQIVFPAQQAALMNAFVRAMTAPAMSLLRTTLEQMQAGHRFQRWLTIPALWDPDFTLLHNFGTLSDVDNKLSGLASRRVVRCSPLFSAFIENHIGYKKSIAGQDPFVALLSLLRVCFVGQEKLFQNAWSPFNLLCSSNLVLDQAFLRAVVAASRWLGPEVMPVGYTATWPPTQDD